MRIAIVQFPGSNCERETMLAVKRAGMEPVEFLWNGPREQLRAMQGYIIVGGFAYEDRSRAGIIAALDTVMQEIAVQSASGKPVLGICNGAQILVETGLVPGLENNKIGMVLAENKRKSHNKILGTGFYNAWVHVRLSDQYQRNAFTRHLKPNSILHLPVAHGEGRFVMTEALLREMWEQGLGVFQYCDADGKVSEHFPVNPNGSTRNIAAVTNKAGNVMAIMPHPERTTAGDALFQSMRDYIAEGRVEDITPLGYWPRFIKPSVYPCPPSDQGWHQCIVELMITDNQALTVQNTLRQLGFPVTVKRQVHWEIQCTSPQILSQIKAAGVLYNDRKERAVSREETMPANSAAYLVLSRDDVLGQQKRQTLEDHFAVSGITALRHGILWHFSSESAKITDFIDDLLHTNIIHNPYAHECYQYHRSKS